MTDTTGLPPKRDRFVREYIIDHNASQAAIRAGYSRKTAPSQGARLLKDAKVRAAVARLDAKAAEDCGLSVQWVLSGLKENFERAMQATPVVDREGNPTGEYQYEGAVANRSLELVGKHFGLFADRLKVEDLTTLSDADLAAIAAGRPPK
jgi:phage terminase small subunit